MMIRGLLRPIFNRHFHVIPKSKTTIKPSSPTPSNFKKYILPIHDKTAMDCYVPLVLFYPSQNTNHSAEEMAEAKSNRLKHSLSEALTKYYPFAGRLRSLTHVDCSDEGVDFVEARIEGKLSEVMKKSLVVGEEGLGKFIPPGLLRAKTLRGDFTLMVVQLVHFDCGGLAISVATSHKLGDAWTLRCFLYYWAALSRESGDHRPPHFIYSLPQSDDDDYLKFFEKTVGKITDSGNSWITKEFVFPNTKLAELKALVKNEKHTRLEVLTALIYRCAVVAAAKSNSGSFIPSVLGQIVNMRSLMAQPLPETTVGNYVVAFFVPTRNESETKLSSLAGRVKEGKMQLRGKKSMNGGIDLRKSFEYMQNGNNMYGSTSMCNFLVDEQLDFGWGPPINVSLVQTLAPNCFIFMDTPSKDGIRALVGLDEQDMETFQRDKELLAYTSSGSVATDDRQENAFP